MTTTWYVPFGCAFLVACGGSTAAGTNTRGTGGFEGVGGATGGAVSAGTGGTAVTGTGGAAGYAAQTGGIGNASGASSTSDTSPNTCTPKVLYDFNASLQGFRFNEVVTTPPYVNLVAPGGASVSNNIPQLKWADMDYDGLASSPGSMMIQAAYTDWNQSVSVEVNGPFDAINNPVDLSAMVLHAQVFLLKGLSPSAGAPGGVIFYMKTGSTYASGQAPWATLIAGGWFDLTFDTSTPVPGNSADFNPKLPVQLGLQFTSGGGGAAGAFGSGPLDTTIFVDHITMVPRACM